MENGVLQCFQGSIYWKIPPSPLGGKSADVIWGKNMERRREKGENVKEKGRKGKENEKRGSKTACRERGKNIMFKRRGINIFFGPKFRPLDAS